MTPRAPSPPSRGGFGTRTVRGAGAPAPGRTGSTVSGASAARFAARVRARRLKRAAMVSALLVVVVVAGWAAFAAPWARVEQVRVSGVERVPEEQVLAIARTQLGSPLLLVDTGAVARAVGGLRLVRGASVHRNWPSTLLVRVTERRAEAAIPVDGGVLLVDDEGVEVARAAEAPTGVPVVRVDLAAEGGAEALRAVLGVLDGLPADLRGQVRSGGASGGDGVWTLLSDGSRVRWGSDGDLVTKVDALRALRALPRSARPSGKVDYDVSAPQAPAVRRRG